MSFNLNANIDFNKTGDQLERCDHTGVTVKYDIEISCLPCIIQNSVWPRFKFRYLSPVFWNIYLFSVNMVRRRISDAQRWQIIGMWSTRISFKPIEGQMGYHYTIVSWFVRKHTQTNTRKDLPISGRPHATSQREDRALHRLFRWMPFATSPVLIRQWLPSRRLSARTVRNRLKSAGRKSRRVIKCYQIHINDYVWRGIWCDAVWIWGSGVGSYVGRELVSASCNRWTVMIWVVFLMIAS